ncbi:TPA: hypothetical protein EYP66_10620 [Candidatus Poribacteria bacterium]|nr:hypothetical protein [Candidatus Poribacteria bacterium]
MASKDQNKVILFGLDGGTFNVIRPMIDDGLLRNLQFLISNGCSGVLQSCFPPITSPAWLCLATGKNPGRLDVYSFLKENREGMKYQPVTSQDFIRNGSIWDYLSEAGKKVGILDYPILYPPYPVNGFMVSGLTLLNDKSSYPEGLKKQLDEICGGSYWTRVSSNSPKYLDNEGLFIGDIEQSIENCRRAINYLLGKKQPDLFIVVLSATDFLQHYLWKYWDENHPEHIRGNPKFQRYKDEFIRLWERVDDVIGDVLKLSGENTNLFIVSDHGFGAQYRTFRLNAWLEKEGYLVRKRTRKIKSQAYFKMKGLAWALRKLKLLSPGRIKRGRELFTPLNLSVIRQIDSEKSIAYALQTNNVFGAIRILAPVKDKLTQGELIRLKGEIIEKLADFGKGQSPKLVIRGYLPEEIYTGDYDTWAAPDIMLDVNDFECMIDTQTFSKELIQNGTQTSSKSGIHRIEGVLIAHGPWVENNHEVKNATIFDIAPTLLYILGQPIPDDMDGKVLQEIMRNEFLEKHPISYQESNLFAEKSYQAEEELDMKQIEKQLKGLGYL